MHLREGTLLLRDYLQYVEMKSQRTLLANH